MELFDEQKLYGSAGLCMECMAPDVDGIARETLGRRHASSLVTQVRLDADDFSRVVWRRSGYGRKLLFTNRKGYAEHRLELADMFPFAAVCSFREPPFICLKPDVEKKLRLLYLNNYSVIPFYETSSGRLGCRCWLPAYHRGIEVDGSSMAALIDVFFSGKVVTDEAGALIGNAWSRNLSAVLRMYAMCRRFLNAEKGFEKALNITEEVLA